MSYADHIGANPSQRPTCWGNAKSYEPNDVECSECRYRHSCRAEIDRSGTVRSVPVTSGRDYGTYRRRTPDDAGAHNAGIVGEHERPIERFAKDAVGGMLRGMFHEMWQFWVNYRIR